RSEAWKHRVHVRARHRELSRPEVVHRVAECVDAVAVDVSDRAGGTKLEIARQEVHADGVARFERSFKRHLAAGRAAKTAAHRQKTLIPERRSEQVRDFGFE